MEPVGHKPENRKNEGQNFAAVALPAREGGAGLEWLFVEGGTKKVGEEGHISSWLVEGTGLSFNECTGNVKAGKGLRTAKGSLIRVESPSCA